MLAGKNVTGVSATGSGKTAVFALPILQRLSADPYGVYAVILTPTRELAMQIDDQMEAFGAPIHVRVSLVIGGEDFVAQAESSAPTWSSPRPAASCSTFRRRSPR